MIALGRHRWVGPLIGLVVVFVLFAILLPGQLTKPITIMTMARATAVVGIAASGTTMVIILGGIDARKQKFIEYNNSAPPSGSTARPLP